MLFFMNYSEVLYPRILKKMYSEIEFSSFKNTFKASFILSKEVDFQTNSTVNFVESVGGALVELLSSRQISSSAVILTMWPLLFHLVTPS